MVIYDRYDIVFQELPGEVALAFTLKGCPNLCKGCHSPHLRETTGYELTLDIFSDIISRYERQATATLFLGGDAYQNELIPLIDIAKSKGFKTGVYSGLDELNMELLKVVDYYKVGRYVEKLGGITSPATNQRLFKMVGGKREDITYMFRR